MASNRRPSRRPRATAAEAESQRLWRLAGLGGTMTSEVLGGVLVGWLLDYFLGTKPTLLIVGAVAGVIIGMTTFIRGAWAQSRGQNSSQNPDPNPHQTPPPAPTPTDQASTPPSDEATP